METYGFIGTGNMASAIIAALSQTVSAQQIFLSNRTQEKAHALAQIHGCNEATNHEIAASCRYIFLGVKPQMMESVLADIAPILAQRGDEFVLVSMAVALSCQNISNFAGGKYPVIRMMPNTPCAVGQGVIQFCTENTTQEMNVHFKQILEKAGFVDQIEESFMDAAAAVSGCGPAFFYYYIDAIARGGEACGLSYERALSYAIETAMGAAAMMRASDQSPQALINAVCSPGGTTIEGIKTLDAHKVSHAAQQAVCAAVRRTKQLQETK